MHLLSALTSTQGAARIDKIRNEVFDALGTVPAMVKKAECYKEICSSPDLDLAHPGLVISIL